MINRNILLLISIVFCTANLFGQLYQKFPTSVDKPIWGIQNTVSGRFNTNESWAYDFLTMIGDTIINGKTYQKVYSLSDTVVLEKNIKEFICAIRESENKEIFRINKGKQAEDRLFDYSLMIGDTASFTIEGNLLELNRINYIDTIELKDGNHLEYGTDHDFWIDGVGNKSSAFGYYESDKPAVINNYKILTTFKKNDVLIYGEYFKPQNKFVKFSNYFETCKNEAVKVWDRLDYLKFYENEPVKLEDRYRYFDSSGYYIDTTITLFGPDIINEMDITVYNISHGFIDTTIFYGDTLLFLGQSYYSSGVYFDTLKQYGNGCDSILRINIIVLDTTTNFQSDIDDIVLRIYPNPSKKYLFIKSISPLVRYTITDLKGVMVKNDEIYSSETSIELDEIQKGVYILILETNEGQSILRKIIIQ